MQKTSQRNSYKNEVYELRSHTVKEQLEECVVTKGESPGTLLEQMLFFFSFLLLRES